MRVGAVSEWRLDYNGVAKRLRLIAIVLKKTPAWTAAAERRLGSSK
jgi:hypothetical protein